MPILAQSADGVQHQFPDGTNPAVIDGVMKQYAAQAQSSSQGLPQNSTGPQAAADGKVDANGSISAGSYAEDMAKSLGAGLVKGAEGMAGQFGDMGQRSGEVLARSVSALGGGDTAQNIARTVGKGLLGPLAMAPTTPQVQQAVEGIAPAARAANDFKPQTTPGDYAQTIGEFAPNAIVGPGGIVKKAVQTVIPAVASEAAGQLAKGTPFEGLARVGGALAAGGAVGAGDSVLGNRADSKALSSAAATRQGLVDAKNTAYTQAEQTLGKQQVPPEQFAELVNSLHAEGAKAGLGGAMSKTTDGLYPNSKNVLADAGDYLQKVSSGEAPPPTYGDLEHIRQVLGDIKQSSKDVRGNISKDGFLAGKMQDLIDRTMGDNNPYQDARGAFQTMRKTQLLDQAISVGSEAASGPDNGIKLEIQKLIKANVKNPQFSPEEVDAMRRATEGAGPLGLVTLLGKFGFSKEHVTAMLPGFGVAEGAKAGHKAFGLPGAVVGAVGAGIGANVAKRASTAARINAANDARNVVALGGRGNVPPPVRRNALSNFSLNTLSALNANPGMAQNALSALQIYQPR